ncbi:MAG: hypothetical protein JRN09_05925 [Nitrososphaerota archaeon]|nr:hypothetical protein [Nitrososphaerota archaeon]
MAEKQRMEASSRAATIAITAVLYAVAKGATAYIHTPWGVGELLIGIFVPAFFAVVSDTWSAAIGAGLGTFIGDTFFLTATGSTNPALSLIAGVPANFIAFLLFGWFVKRYTSWGGFVAATLSFVTLGNLIAASSIVFFGASVFTAVGPLVAAYPAEALIFGFTAFWSLTMIPFIIIVVPLLVRAVKPLRGRSSIISSFPEWGEMGLRTVILGSFLLAVAFAAAIFLYLPGVVGLAGYPAVTDDVALVIVALVIVVPVAGEAMAAGRRP